MSSRRPLTTDDAILHEIRFWKEQRRERSDSSLSWTEGVHKYSRTISKSNPVVYEEPDEEDDEDSGTFLTLPQLEKSPAKEAHPVQAKELLKLPPLAPKNFGNVDTIIAKNSAQISRISRLLAQAQSLDPSILHKKESQESLFQDSEKDSTDSDSDENKGKPEKPNPIDESQTDLPKKRTSSKTKSPAQRVDEFQKMLLSDPLALEELEDKIRAYEEQMRQQRSQSAMERSYPRQNANFVWDMSRDKRLLDITQRSRALHAKIKHAQAIKEQKLKEKEERLTEMIRSRSRLSDGPSSIVQRNMKVMAKKWKLILYTYKSIYPFVFKYKGMQASKLATKRQQRAARTIQFAFRAHLKARRAKRELQAVQVLTRFVLRVKMKIMLKRKNREVEIVKRFLQQVHDVALITRRVQHYRYQVLCMQRLIRQHITRLHTRLQVLSLQYQKMESEILPVHRRLTQQDMAYLQESFKIQEKILIQKQNDINKLLSSAQGDDSLDADAEKKKSLKAAAEAVFFLQTVTATPTKTATATTTTKTVSKSSSPAATGKLVGKNSSPAAGGGGGGSGGSAAKKAMGRQKTLGASPGGGKLKSAKDMPATKAGSEGGDVEILSDQKWGHLYKDEAMSFINECLQLFLKTTFGIQLDLLYKDLVLRRKEFTVEQASYEKRYKKYLEKKQVMEALRMAREILCGEPPNEPTASQQAPTATTQQEESDQLIPLNLLSQFSSTTNPQNPTSKSNSELEDSSLQPPRVPSFDLVLPKQRMEGIVVHGIAKMRRVLLGQLVHVICSAPTREYMMIDMKIFVESIAREDKKNMSRLNGGFFDVLRGVADERKTQRLTAQRAAAEKSNAKQARGKLKAAHDKLIAAASK